MKEHKDKKPTQKPSRPGTQIMSAILIFMVIVVLYSAISKPDEKIAQFTLSDVAKNITENKIDKIVVEGEKVNIDLKDGTKAEAKKEPESALSDTLDRKSVV